MVKSRPYQQKKEQSGAELMDEYELSEPSMKDNLIYFLDATLAGS